jgi:hypothetical protein
MAFRTAIGNIIEMPIGRQFGYFQIINRSKRYGELVRAFDGLFDEPIDKPELIAECPDLFTTFTPADIYVSRKLYRKVGEVAIRPDIETRPTLKAKTVHDVYYLYDCMGDSERRVCSFQPYMAQMPWKGIWTLGLIEAGITQRYRVENDPAGLLPVFVDSQ